MESEFMKEMKYGLRLDGAEVLVQGQYNGFNYWILNLGTHPTAYVEIPKNHKYFNQEYDDIPVECHYGLTYSENYLSFLEYSEKYKCMTKQGIHNTWIIGWDYAHSGDYMGYDSPLQGKKWTTTEIFEEVKTVITQLRRVARGEKSFRRTVRSY